MKLDIPMSVKERVRKSMETFKGINIGEYKKSLGKWSLKTIAINTIGVSAIVGVVAASPQNAKPQSNWNSEVKLDTSRELPVVLPSKKIAIKVKPKSVKKTKKPVAMAYSQRRTVTTREIPRVKVSKAKPGSKRALVQAAAKRYNIPWQVLEAVWQVETGKRWDTGVCSYAGACGPMQFIPSTWRAYAVDGDGDGRKVITDAHDAVYTAARYLAANGANRGRIYNALYRYNHADWYVQKVLRVARSIGYGG